MSTFINDHVGQFISIIAIVIIVAFIIYFVRYYEKENKDI
jgi:hypothetical protein